jgi:hypothetical protein
MALTDPDTVTHLAWPGFNRAALKRDGGTLTARCGHERIYAPGEWSDPPWPVVCRRCFEALRAEMSLKKVTI